MDTVKVPPTSEAPKQRLCWQRPALAGELNPMLSPCDRAKGHGGKHSWELPEEVRRMAADLRKRADSFESTTIEARILSELAGKLERLAPQS